MFLSVVHSNRSGRPAHVISFVLMALMALAVLFIQVNSAWASNIYDSQVLQRMKFDSSQRAKVGAIMRKSDNEMSVVFRKYGINPNAKPDFEKLQRASSELQAVEAREKREMKKILTREQYATYLELLQRTAARVIKATRTKP